MTKKKNRVIRAIDLCSGAGGWACAARGLPINIVMAVDLWPTACKTYKLNHPQTYVICGDIRDEGIQAVIAAAKPELILGGIPCEWLSVYRILSKVKAAELADQRATLDAALDLVKRLDPRWWCLEDVIGLIKHLPIMTPYNVINSRGYSAQRRKRVFVGTYPLPTTGNCKEVLRNKLRPGPYRIGPRAFERTPQLARTFSNTTCLAAMPDRKAPTVMGISSRRDAEMVVVDDAIAGGKRQMEWQEAASSQGFPDDYVFYGGNEQVATQVARAIQIDTGRAILEAIVRDWQGGKASQLAEAVAECG